MGPVRPDRRESARALLARIRAKRRASPDFVIAKPQAVAIQIRRGALCSLRGHSVHEPGLLHSVACAMAPRNVSRLSQIYGVLGTRTVKLPVIMLLS